MGDGGGEERRTDGTTSFWVVLLCEPVGTLILKVGLCRTSVWEDAEEKKERRDVLSHATVKRMIQLGFLMYDVTRLSTREISLACPCVLLTLAINPIQKKIIIPN